ncbi:MAG: hypothetical protein IIY23_00635 [Erysipelotrichaceae bacterium]|nr:hypothetical protein [Erysipelotrichaceae bacterium]
MKQIYASLEFSENEIRLLVGEYFNTRFNVIKLERVTCDGLTNCRITDHDKVKEALQKVLENTSKMLGAKVEQVILLIPSINMRRYPLKVTLPTKHGYLSKEDIAYALSQTMRTPVDSDVTIINASIIRYIVNGISYRRLPEKEVCDEFAVDIDLLCADKKIAFEYAALLDECELKIMDVCLDSYAIGKEAALFERTLNRNLILLNINDTSTVLSLLSKGKLISCETVFEGLNGMAGAVVEKYGLPYPTVRRLIKYNTSYGGEYRDDAVYVWNKNGKENYSINEKDLSECIEPKLNEYIDKIAMMSEPILKSGPTSIIVTGNGASMQSLLQQLQNKLEISVKPYFPDTIGVRDSALTALYGAFFAYRDTALLKGEEKSSVDLMELEKVISSRSDDVEAETLTSKIRGLFEMSKRKEEE